METKKAEKTRLVEWAYPSHVQLKLQRWGKEKKKKREHTQLTL